MAAAMKAADAAAALFKYLSLKDPGKLRNNVLNSGKDEEAYLVTTHITKEGGHHHDGHLHVGSVFKDGEHLRNRGYESRGAADREANVRGDEEAAARLEAEVDSTGELHGLLTRYCSDRTRKGQQFLCVHGWLRLVRDLEVLDNKVGLGQAVAIFETADGLVQRPGRNGLDLEPKADAKAFRRLVSRLAQLRYPSSPAPLQALLAWHAPLAHGAPADSRFRHPANGVPLYPVAYDGDVVAERDAPPPPPPPAGDELDDIASLAMCDLLKSYRAPLRRVYAHYCTLPLLSCVYSTWPHVKEANRAMSEGEFLRMCSDFHVAPLLLERQECIAAFRAANRDAEFTDRNATAVGSFPMFCEALLRCSLRCASRLPRRLRSIKTACTEAVASMRLADMSEDLNARRELEACFDTRRVKMGMAAPMRIGTTDEDFNARAELALETQRKNQQLKREATMPTKERMRRAAERRQVEQRKAGRELAASAPPPPSAPVPPPPLRVPPISLNVVIGGPVKSQSRSATVSLNDFIDADADVNAFDDRLESDPAAAMAAFEQRGARTFASADAEMLGWSTLPAAVRTTATRV